MQNAELDDGLRTSPCAGSANITAQNESVISIPQLTDVHAARDINFHNTYVHPSARTDKTNVPSKTEENIPRCQAELKSYLENETNELFQGAKASSTLLDNIYTELYITEGGSGEVNSEHEVIELECKRCPNEEKKIYLNDIFRPLSNDENSPQRILTKGIAGIGKSVAVQKFTHDWATGKANQTFQFIFPFTFRDLNLIKDESWSLQSLIHHYFEEVKNLETSYYNSSSVLFIFDGLDESTIPLDFKKNELCRSVTKPTTLDVLLTNLIKGKLLPKASVWITSRPAAATKIPPEFIHRVTEVRGFNDEQKEEYFQKEVKEEDMAQKVLEHLQSKLLRSLFIMCHIPLFCEISATVLMSLLKKTPKRELPKTLTEMYTHFLIIQTKKKHEKDYQFDETDKELIMKLGKLAFEQLEKGNMIFYEEDLRHCQIDLTQAAEYSGVCTKIIRRESGLHQREVYSFIHLTVQEFLAALYVLETFLDSGENLLTSQRVSQKRKGEIHIHLLHRNAVDKALGHDYGQWDLFLRFLLGLSQDKNQELLQKELHFKSRRLQNNQETINYIHEKIQQLSDTDKSINLFHCLNELGDQSLVEQVQTYMSSGDVSKISPSHWSALAFLLLVSNEDLDVFDMKKYHNSGVVLERLLPVLKASKIALLSDCRLTNRSYKHISSALCFKSSRLEELDLSGSNLRYSGVKLVAEGLKSVNCKLQKLRLVYCGLTKSGCAALASSLKSNPAHMRVLDLTENYFADDGVINLSEFLAEPLCRLETLRLAYCVVTESDFAALASSLKSNPAHMRVLDLRENHFGDDGVRNLSEFLADPLCRLETLILSDCRITKSGSAALSSSLKSNPAHMRVLDLSGNYFRDDDVRNLSEFLALCRLETLILARCGITESGCAALASSLKSNPAHMRVLDPTGNLLGDVGVRNLSEFLAEPLCQLETLILARCGFTVSGCAALASSLNSNPAHMRVLDLTENFFGDGGAENLSEFLAEPLCRLETLILALCGLTKSGCAALASSLKSNPAHMRVLDLTGNHFRDDGVRNLSEFLALCRLETLILARCGITESGCAALVSSLKSNPAHMRVLDLSENKFGDDGVRNLSEFLAVRQLETLKLSHCTGRGCEFLASALRSNPSALTELEMTCSIPGKSGVKLLTDLKEDPSYKLQTLTVYEKNWNI